LSRPAGKAKKSIAPGLKRVRKEIPPPSKAFDSKKRYSRKRAGEEARQALEASLAAGRSHQQPLL
jgi:hypothetical protein